MKTKQLSFEFPYRSNADDVVKLEQFLRQNLLEIEKKYNYDKDYKWELQKLKKDREDKDYRTEVRHKINKEIYVAPHPFDDAMQNIKHLVDQAIDDALSEGVIKKNYDDVMKLKTEESNLLGKIHATTVYNEETGYWVPSDNVWLYHYVRIHKGMLFYPYLIA
jgi:ribosomal protein S20